jgi:predicted SAM-dependent methyltransferase
LQTSLDIRAIAMIKKLYRRLKYRFIISPEEEHLLFHKKRQKQMIERYIASCAIKKLQIGAQFNSIDGWLNVDIQPKDHQTVYMDATQKFPFPDASFDYIFSEHMIEHITYQEAVFMLGECYRILKPNGKIRIATPNLEVLIKVMAEPDKINHKKYIEFFSTSFLGKVPHDPVFVMNGMFYLFGHKFLHTESSLKRILSQAGFHGIKAFAVGESDDTSLQKVEQHGVAIGVEFNELETFILQGVR